MKDTDVGAGQLVGGDPAVLECLPGDMQQESLLGVERVGLAG